MNRGLKGIEKKIYLYLLLTTVGHNRHKEILKGKTFEGNLQSNSSSVINFHSNILRPTKSLVCFIFYIFSIKTR